MPKPSFDHLMSEAISHSVRREETPPQPCGVAIQFHNADMMDAFTTASQSILPKCRSLRSDKSYDLDVGLVGFVAPSRRRAEQYADDINKAMKHYDRQMMDSLDTPDWMAIARENRGMGIEYAGTHNHLTNMANFDRVMGRDFRSAVNLMQDLLPDTKMNETIDQQTVDRLGAVVGEYFHHRFGPMNDTSDAETSLRQWTSLTRTMVGKIAEATKPVFLIDAKKFRVELALMKEFHESLVARGIVKPERIGRDVEEEEKAVDAIRQFNTVGIVDNFKRSLVAGLRGTLDKANSDFEGDPAMMVRLKELNFYDFSERGLAERLDSDRLMNMDRDDRVKETLTGLVSHTVKVIQLQNENRFREELKALSARMITEGACYHQEIFPLMKKSKGLMQGPTMSVSPNPN